MTTFMIDGLSKYEVYVESREMIDHELIGKPHRQMFRNTQKDRDKLKSIVAKEMYEEILKIWGNEPLKPEDFF